MDLQGGPARRPRGPGRWTRSPPTASGSRSSAGNDTIRAYVAYPERKTKAPAVIVIHEIFGLTDWEPTVADRLAKEGFVAIVPDLLSSKYGKSPADPDEGRKLVGELEPERVTADLNAAYAYVNGLPSVAQGPHRDDRLLLGRGAELPLRHQQPQPQGGRGRLRAARPTPPT